MSNLALGDEKNPCFGSGWGLGIWKAACQRCTWGLGGHHVVYTCALRAKTQYLGLHELTEGEAPFPLLSNSEITSGLLGPVLGSPAQNRHGWSTESLLKHRRDHDRNKAYVIYLYKLVCLLSRGESSAGIIIMCINIC